MSPTLSTALELAEGAFSPSIEAWLNWNGRPPAEAFGIRDVAAYVDTILACAILSQSDIYTPARAEILAFPEFINALTAAQVSQDVESTIGFFQRTVQKRLFARRGMPNAPVNTPYIDVTADEASRLARIINAFVPQAAAAIVV